MNKFRCIDVAEVALSGAKKGPGSEVSYLCPIHDDHHPSLQINKDKDCWLCGPCGAQGNAWQLAAFIAGVDPENKAALIPWLKAKGLLGESPRNNGSKGERTSGLKKEFVCAYIYKDEAATPVFKIDRINEGGGKKSFRASRPDGNGGVIPGMGDVQTVPYRLPEFKDSPIVAIVEGESDADKLSEWIPTTTNPFGAGKWPEHFNPYFKDKNVLIFPDHDEVGEAHAREVATGVFPFAQGVKIIRLPGLEPKGDVSDWIEAGGTKEQLQEIVKEDPALTKEEFEKWGKEVQTVSRYAPAQNVITFPGTQPTTSIAETLTAAGFDDLTEELTGDDIEKAIRRLTPVLEGADPLRRMVVRTEAAKRLSKLNVKGPMGLLDSVLTQPQHDQSNKEEVPEPEVEPWSEPVEGTELLAEIKSWIGGFVVVPEEALVAIALWTTATWFVAVGYFAPILMILSPTKQSGKTLLFDLLTWICRSAYLTSGVGITAPVIFRVNEQRLPTYLIDEAEKLGGKNADKEIIGLLNAGYRRGGKVQRLREKKGGGYEVEDFDAFGFRALAAIGMLWNTIMDRSVVIPMKRKPRNVKRKRYNGRVVESEGKELQRKICRFAQDNIEAVGKLQEGTPRPEWLSDRGCDNWSGLFAVAQLAGGDWPQRALDAAKALSNVTEDGDLAERLVHDTRQIFKEEDWPEAIRSGHLIKALNAIESSPWGDYNKRDGISTHKVAAMFKPFEIRPLQDRDSSGMKVRGYWLKDLKEVFERYPTPPELGQLGQLNNDGGSSDFQSGTKEESCPSSESPETLVNTGLSQLSQSERGGRGELPINHAEGPEETHTEDGFEVIE